MGIEGLSEEMCYFAAQGTQGVEEFYKERWGLLEGEARAPLAHFLSPHQSIPKHFNAKDT